MERHCIAVRGIVQGVGFRPFVHALASRHQLRGFVVNDREGVAIEVEGDPHALERFVRELVTSPPPLARIDEWSARQIPPRGDAAFRIESSRPSALAAVVTPDAATCRACLAELFDPSNRRYRYPFITCAHCGPRLTIIAGAPYDRQRTTMAAFPLCERCRREYDDPADRRFHAEAIACATCGPRLSVCDGSGRPLDGEPVRQLVRAVLSGSIVAVKGLGGYHLACDATNDAAVSVLRARKHREEKPFAIMVRDLTALDALCEVTAGERALLESPARPIVLLRRRRQTSTRVSDAVAPCNPRLGVMLPYTPLHHLLMDGVGDLPLVMTSGNASDEPIASDDRDVLSRLGSIADLFVQHDRAIHVRCDDSVLHVSASGPAPLRRSRGYAPAPLRLPFECPVPILAVGGQLKNTFTLGRGRQAFVSHHLGDLDDYRAFDAFRRDVALYQRLFDVNPDVVACDLHPDYASTSFAAAFPAATRIGVQHHHAHIASCMAEQGLDGDVIGIAWDGTGWGTDGMVWGAEFLVGGYRDVTRFGRFRPIVLPGGERAITEPWRVALAHLIDAGVEDHWFVPAGVATTARRTIRTMIARRVNAPLASSAGRLFDAVAALLGVRDRVSFEGQAAMELEWLAETAEASAGYPFGLGEFASGRYEVDTRPLIAAVAADCRSGIARGLIARRFHQTLVDVIAQVAGNIRRDTGLSRVVMSGGVFANNLLARGATAALEHAGFQVFSHHLVPAGDGGLSLGQVAVAAARLRAPASGGS
jgi:hydrogenase maturation protein HypF